MAYGWHVIDTVDGHNADAVAGALADAKAASDKPTIICCQTLIGKGSPNKEGTGKSHGAPLGDDEIALVRERIGWQHPAFEIPDHIYAGWDQKQQGQQAEAQWQAAMDKYRAAYPELASEFERRIAGDLPAEWETSAQAYIDATDKAAEKIATRKASQNALNGYGPVLPELIGGSADLAGSNLTIWSGSTGIQDDAAGNYIYYGVREFGMSAIQNGICLHGGFRSYAATFLMFSEYARNALRMAALMKLPGIFVFTHDSVGLGEDGPTHQPIEQTATLRLMPRMALWRPCDAVETAVAWKQAIERTCGPTSLILTRQGLAHQPRTDQQLEQIARGGYVLSDCDGTPDAILIASGSEVGLAVEAKARLQDDGKNVRVVSMPSTDRFDEQDQAYRDSVLPPAVKARVAVEAGVMDGWIKYVGLEGATLGIETFGESGKAEDVFEHFGLNAENVAAAVNNLL